MRNEFKQSDEMFLKFAITKSFEQQGKELLEENQRLKQEAHFNANKADMQFLEKMFKSQNPYSAKRKRRFSPRTFAVAAAAIILVSSFCVVTAFKIPILDFFLYDEKFSINISENYRDMDLHAIYVPAYLPEGYKAVGLDNKESAKNITYQSGNGDGIWFTQYSSTTGLNVDSEGAVVEKIQERDFEATIIRKNGVKVLWGNNDKIFLLHAELSELEPELLKMAKSITFVE